MISEKVIATRAAEPASAPVAVTGFQADENGKFTVTIAADKETMDALADNNKSVALALRSRARPRPRQKAMQMKKRSFRVLPTTFCPTSPASSMRLRPRRWLSPLYKDGEVYSDETIMMPFNSTVAESKATLLKDGN